jgi:hypothetical protein
MSVRKYVKEVEESLGAVGRPFRLSEAGRKIAWGSRTACNEYTSCCRKFSKLYVVGQERKGLFAGDLVPGAPTRLP